VGDGERIETAGREIEGGARGVDELLDLEDEVVVFGAEKDGDQFGNADDDIAEGLGVALVWDGDCKDGGDDGGQKATNERLCVALQGIREGTVFVEMSKQGKKFVVVGGFLVGMVETSQRFGFPVIERKVLGRDAQ
jgi:hypothetical protein